MPRLLDRYKNEIVPGMTERFGYTNPMAVPRVQKVVLSIGVGNGHEDKTRLEQGQKDLPVITGQIPAITRARMSIAAFKIRDGYPVGLKVTLRGIRMLEFLDRLIGTAIPRVRDFRGLATKGFDGRGNYSLGVTEQLIFPEIHADDVQIVQGMNVTICTSAKTDEEALELLRLFGMPFRTN
ncbi:MAG: 50S ribosomal protein L5 [Candidatus Brocadiae bacterium]|nr:50S ribosomal protein L5 [Candidatus Brocadiia bacterium]